MRRMLTLAACVATLAGCTLPATHHTTPALSDVPTFSYADPSDDCAPGVITIDANDDPTCNLVGGRNTLDVIDVDEAWADLHGCAWERLEGAAGVAHACDF